jgi:hypothetical protein
MISDSSPGSTVDAVLRLITDGMSQHWGQQVLVINHAGAAGGDCRAQRGAGRPRRLYAICAVNFGIPGSVWPHAYRQWLVHGVADRYEVTRHH